jgi:hypothetical protein
MQATEAVLAPQVNQIFIGIPADPFSDEPFKKKGSAKCDMVDILAHLCCCLLKEEVMILHSSN